MHIQVALLGYLLAIPTLISATGQLGFAIGGTNPDGTCKTQSDFEADFNALKSHTTSTLVRTYSSSSCNTTTAILPAAQNSNFKVLLGMWPDNNSYQKEKTLLLNANLPQYTTTIYGITVGSEGIYRGTYTESDLLSWLTDMQTTFPTITIGTADSWSSWTNGSMDNILKSGIKLVLANAFPYWQYQDITNATKSYFDAMAQTLEHVQTISGSLDGIHFMNGETGWPSTGGTDAGAAKASTSNAATYWKSAICGMLTWGVDVFSFEAFDEPGKIDAVGDGGRREDERHWGTFDAGRGPKFEMGC